MGAGKAEALTIGDDDRPAAAEGKLQEGEFALQAGREQGLGALSRPSPWTPTPYESTAEVPVHATTWRGTRTVPETAIVLLLVAAVVTTCVAAQVSPGTTTGRVRSMVSCARGIEAVCREGVRGGVCTTLSFRRGSFDQAASRNPAVTDLHARPTGHDRSVTGPSLTL